MIKYSTVTQTKSISVPYPLEIDLVKGGDGTGVGGMNLRSEVTCTAKLIGGAKFYTDSAGTLGETDTINVVLSTESQANYYKCTTATSKLVFSSKRIRDFYFYSDNVNKPKIPILDVTHWKALKIYIANDVTCTIGSVSGLVNLEQYMASKASNNTGSFLNSPNLSVLYVTGKYEGGFESFGALSDFDPDDLSSLHNLVNVGLIGTRFKIDFDQMPQIQSLQDCTMDLRGHIGSNAWMIAFKNNGTNTVYADLDTMPNLVYWRVEAVAGCGVTVESSNRLINNTKLSMYRNSDKVYTSAIVNQMLADLRTNNEVTKIYSDGYRTYMFNIAAGCQAPTGQGITDKNYLNAWTGGSGQKNYVTTV
jgi:hypothetical protein